MEGNQNKISTFTCMGLFDNKQLREIMNIMRERLDSYKGSLKNVLTELGFDAELTFVSLYEHNLHQEMNKTKITEPHMCRVMCLNRLLHGIFAFIEMDGILNRTE
jgi:hypothetical protein